MNITVDRAVIEQALAVLENPMYGDFYEWTLALKDARDALRTALGQQYMTNAAGELEPVTVVQTGVGVWKMEPLSDEEIQGKKTFDEALHIAAQQALQALEKTWRMDMVVSDVFPAMQALSKALRELEKQND